MDIRCAGLNSQLIHISRLSIYLHSLVSLAHYYYYYYYYNTN